MQWGELLVALGMGSVAALMLILALLSKRLGSVTRTPRYYIGLYASSVLVIISVLMRLWNMIQGVSAADLSRDPTWVVIYIGLPALAFTIAVIVAWRYWSWLLAERG